MTDLYDRDIVAWTEEQATALRRLAERPDLTNVIDWENLIEEIETLGRSELKGVTSPLFNVFVHVLKGIGDPGSLASVHWGKEVRTWLREARSDFTPAMRQKIDLSRIWLQASEVAGDELGRYSMSLPPGIPSACPFTLDEILAEDFTFDAACRKLHDMAAARVAANKDGTR